MNKRKSGVLLMQYACALLFSALLSLRCAEEKNKIVTSNDTTIKSDSLAFGDTKFLSNGLEGKMYFIQRGARKIPLFDTMQVVNTVYANSINIPARSWSTGFPGLPNRFEWFGIEYKGHFRAIKEGRYKFRLLSDDGSKLFIDDSLLINNDGLHGVVSRTGEIDLDGSDHKIKLQYIQGPRWSIALQLFANIDKEKEQAFPGMYFELTALHGGSTSGNNKYIISGSILLLAIIVITYWATRKKTATKKILERSG